ncbi:ATP-binding cassette domain-containing protein [Virgibacillus sp. MSJ-26]|uniref:ABC transporter ATP-binding protein n=1 Tax=Virgibacillus sp. MSJ-26 TaxID=2841522 RepID=UPI001C0FA7FA|nr:ATP-binding cassette domain-containing protein [Virgibacillus sp. MSJ-26]
MFKIEHLVVENVLKINELKLDASIVSIEGQSGSGKSTLLRLLNNLDTPKSGTIYYNDKSLIEIEPMELRRKIVMVPQDPVVFDGTLRDNLLIGLKLSGQDEISDTSLEDTLKTFWLEDKELDTSASDLSGGEKQRLALARVLLMKEADVYLLDEPSSSLDDETTDHVLDAFIHQAKEQKNQIIMVTHDKRVAEKYTKQKINMDEYSTHIKHEVTHDG